MTGCGGGVKEEVFKVEANNDPFHQPRQLLQRYADGQPLGSESSSYEFIVNKVREVYPAKGDILAAGFEEIKKGSPSARKAKAKSLLEAIQPQVGGPSAE